MNNPENNENSDAHTQPVRIEPPQAQPPTNKGWMDPPRPPAPRGVEPQRRTEAPNRPSPQPRPADYRDWNTQPQPAPPRAVEPERADYSKVKFQSQQKPKRKPSKVLAALLFVLLALAVYLFFPLRTNFLVLGIDPRDETDYGRSDTIILTTVVPLKPTVAMLSIPRDLWVSVPGHGENRINTAHFFGEIDQPGSGPQAAEQAVRENFGVSVDHYVRVRFDGIREIVNAMGGVDITIDSPTAGYDPGTHHLDGDQALAFVRSRAGADDFFRMAHGQLFIKAAIRQMISPASWPRIPQVVTAVLQVVDTDLPVWQLPRLGVALLRASLGSIDSRTISREMVTPWVTDEGAQVLLPNWDAINPVLLEMFGE